MKDVFCLLKEDVRYTFEKSYYMSHSAQMSHVASSTSLGNSDGKKAL